MSTLTHWNPLREMQNLENRLERFWGAALQPHNGEKEALSVSQWTPLVDISEDANEFLVTAELPDLQKKDVKVSVEDGELSISGERKTESETKGRKYHRIERSFGSFQRTFSLPDGVRSDRVTAEFKDGVLRVHLPKDQKARTKSREVKVS